MKRIILMLLTACMALGMAAQDTIVRKDGKTIPAKVLEVSGTHVKYKRFSNPDGPTYVMNTLLLAGITYENGESEAFENSAAPETGMADGTAKIPAFGPTCSEPLEIMPDYYRIAHAYQNLQRLPRTAKRLKRCGYAVGIPMMLTGIMMFSTWYAYCGEPDGVFGLGIAFMGTGALIAASFHATAHRIQKDYNRLMSASLFRQEIPLGGKTRMTGDVNLLRDSFSHQQTVGLGLRLAF